MLVITEYCNLGCSYCYEKGYHNKNKMSIDIAKKTIDYLYSQAVSSNSKDVSITFFGGEPMLNYDVIETIYEYGNSIFKDDIKLILSIITNGTILTDKHYDLFQKMIKDNNFSVQLSIDGPEHVQDIYRNKKDGTSSFKEISENIQKYKKLFENNTNGLNVHGVLGKETLPYLYESFLFFKDSNLNNIWFIPAANIDWTDDDVKIYDEQMGIITKYLVDKKDVNQIKAFAPLSKAFDGRFTRPCGLGSGYVTINHKGDIYPCHQFYFNTKDDIKCGNIFDGADNDRLRMFQCFDNSDLTNCLGCNHSNCYRCVAANYEKFKTPFTQIRDNYCEMMKIDAKYQNKILEEINTMSLIQDQDPENGHYLSNEQYNTMISILREIENKTTKFKNDEEEITSILINILKNLEK
jgi:radical SAM protein with 4Fe4S-binding SPASM domain